MTRPIRYYVSTNPGDNPLLDEIEESWGSTFEALNNCQKLWMINMLSDLALNDPAVFADHELDDEVSELTVRAERELELHQKIRLIEALIVQVKVQ
jgi:hypothetical protein